MQTGSPLLALKREPFIVHSANCYGQFKPQECPLARVSTLLAPARFKAAKQTSAQLPEVRVLELNAEVEEFFFLEVYVKAEKLKEVNR